jgi:hypothetical protein
MGLSLTNDQEFVPIEPEIDKYQIQLEGINEVLSTVLDKQTEIERKTEEQEEQRRIKIEKIELEKLEEIAFEHWKEQINDDIPEFEHGHVQLVEAHEIIGITQNDIDWINENCMGIIKTPRRDIVKTYKTHGYRVCAIGKVYFKGVSER